MSDVFDIEQQSYIASVTNPSVKLHAGEWMVTLLPTMASSYALISLNDFPAMLTTDIYSWSGIPVTAFQSKRILVRGERTDVHVSLFGATGVVFTRVRSQDQFKNK